MPSSGTVTVTVVSLPSTGLVITLITEPSVSDELSASEELSVSDELSPDEPVPSAYTLIVYVLAPPSALIVVVIFCKSEIVGNDFQFSCEPSKDALTELPPI